MAIALTKLSGVWHAAAQQFETPRDRCAPTTSCCWWDGRLDNRAELVERTGLPPSSTADQLALALYQRENVDGLRHLVGDWSLCLWDAERRSVVLASDYAGIRPLYYHWSAGILYWSSAIDEVAGRAQTWQLDELYAASFLLRGNGGGLTPYAGIFAVPPGQAVCVTRDGICIRRFWWLPVETELRYRDDRCYEERLLELFEEAVRVRIRGDRVVCSELSGGLDSSSVACMADRLVKAPAAVAPGLRTFSYTHEKCPDEPYFREVERACGIAGFHLQLDSFPLLAADEAASIPEWWGPRLAELARRMDEMGSYVFLTGQLGDLIMGNTSDDSEQVAEWLAMGNLSRTGQEAYAWARSLGVPIYPILWRSLRQVCSTWVPPAGPAASVGAIQGSAEDSVCKRLADRAKEHERLRNETAPWRQARPWRRRQFRAIHEVLESRSLQAPEPMQHISYAHPFAHRPLVEFMLTIPASVVCGPGQPRRLMRRAFAGLLPEAVLKRKSKAAYASPYRKALQPLVEQMLQRPSIIQVVERGYVDPASLIGRLEKFTQGLECNEPQLRQVILLEYWLRNRAGVRSSATLPVRAAVVG